MTRREWLGSAAAIALAPGPAAETALVAITLDLEMSRHYPTWEQTHWDYEKGNLDRETKRYAVEAARRVKRRGGVIHFFAVGRTLEQDDVSWLVELREAGHPIGNHTYDHVNVKATRPEDIQFRFRRAPWLIEGKTPAEVIAENVAMTSRALRHRVGVSPAGFRTPGGFNDGLRDRPDVRRMLRDQGYSWVSSLYPSHPLGDVGERPTASVLDAIVQAQEKARPFRYPDGLVEVPMNPVSDVSALRAGRWPLDSFLEAVRRSVSWAIDRRETYDFLAHPSCLVAADPTFRAIDLICDLVERSKGRAALTGLDALAARAT
jgi:hypothetical protein